MEKLIIRAKLRNPDAFTELMQSQMQNMYKTARAILYNDEDVADAISETILTCWEKIGQLNDNRYFRTWMTRILVNKCNDLIRKKETLLKNEAPPEQADIDKGFENAEWKAVLETLSETYRLVMMLYYIEGFKTCEISQILEIPESTIRTKLARGREQLADICELRRRTV